MSALTPEAARMEKIREARIVQVVETLCDVFGTVTIDVMFRAIARWFGMVIYNSCQAPADRREVLKEFMDRIEERLAKHEKDAGS